MVYAPLDPAAARQKYGPWAVIAGASDGTGAGFAHRVAAVGINVALIARRRSVLDELSAVIEAAYGVQTRVIVQDLKDDDAGSRILAACVDLEVGLYISNAGVDGSAAAFLDDDSERWLRGINMNVRTLTKVTHGLARLMRQRARGGIVLMSSVAALGGQPWLAMYAATKAFEMVLAEGLWSEFRDAGIDVLAVIAPSMDTPTFRREAEGTGFDLSLAYSVETIVNEVLEALPNGPLLIYPFGPEAEPVVQLTQARVARLQIMASIGRSLLKPPLMVAPASFPPDDRVPSCQA